MVGYHLIVMEGFACSNDPRSLDVWGLVGPGCATHGKQVLGKGPDKA